MRVFVTGATGVLGRRAVPRLVAAGHEVTAVARSSAGELRAVGAVPVAVDLFDAAAVAAAVEGHDAVLDLATRIPDSTHMVLPWAWRENDRLRSVASGHTSDAAIANGARYVRESIGFLYDDAGDDWIDERSPVAPAGQTRSALDAEAAASRVTEAGGVGVVLRFAEFYGPDSGHSRDRVALARRGIAAVIGDLDGFWSRVHLDDAAAAVVAALEVPAGTYNVVDDEPLRRREQVEILSRAVGRSLRTPPAVAGAVGPARTVARSLRLSNRRLRGHGWAPRYASVREGWPEVVAAILEEHAVA